MLSSGTLEICDDSDNHHGFTARYSSKFIDSKSKDLLSFDSAKDKIKGINLWEYIITESLGTDLNPQKMMGEYRTQLMNISSNLDNQCMDGGFGYVELFDDDNYHFNPGKAESTMYEIIRSTGRDIFPL